MPSNGLPLHKEPTETYVWADSFFEEDALPLHLKQTFPPIIWIFTEGEGDGIESRLSS